MKFLLIILCIVCFTYSTNLAESLIGYVIYEHMLIQDQITSKGISFSWKFCPFARFPIEKGCSTYFSGIQKEISYIVHIDDKFYVGEQFSFDSDTIYYKIITYHIINSRDSLIHWERLNDFINITTNQYGEIISKH